MAKMENLWQLFRWKRGWQARFSSYVCGEFCNQNMARDKFHDNVRIALEKDGWKITAEQLRISLGKASIEIDMMADNMMAAERGGEKIAVEVKSFLEKSIIHTFHEAMGQYLDYRSALEVVDAERVVFLAVPTHIYHHDVFQDWFIQRRLREENAKLIIFDSVKNAIETWIK